MIKYGGSVFPGVIWKKTSETSDPVYYTQGGMTIRDWFAGQALVGYCGHDCITSMKQTADWCYEFADAMLEAREKRTR